MLRRPRRNRKSPAIRSLIEETRLLPSDLAAPFFLIDGENKKEPIASMAEVERLSCDLVIKEAEKLHQKGICAIALFPVIDPALKDPLGSAALHEEGLIPKAIRRIKKELPSLCVIADIALDPYTSHGHDGILGKDDVLNDETVEALAKIAILYAECGIDIVAPSDMMDGRVKAIRSALEEKKHHNVSILSYTAKYASSLYAPFRQALGSTLKAGDKKTYQMSPSNAREALIEAALDEQEGADMLMVKPALFYLDILAKMRQATHLPLCAYHVSGEYAMVMAAAEKGILDPDKVFLEALISIKRAGADFILSYASSRVINFL